MKKALFIIAPANFRDEEFLEPKDILEKAGVQLTVASSMTDIAIGKSGLEVKPDITLKDVRVADYDAIVFIGGSGAIVYLENTDAHRIAQEAVQNRKLLAAICVSPLILAHAGVLKGVKATVFPDDAHELAANGAMYTGKMIEHDRTIITGNGPQAAKLFGHAIAEYLTKHT
jgi:protease I